MKIWYGYSSEHSTCMTIIAEFKKVEDMMEAEQGINNNRYDIDYNSTERKHLFSAFSKEFWEDDYKAHIANNNKMIIFTDAFLYSNVVELLLSKNAEVKLAGQDYPIIETELDVPDLRECAEEMGFWFNDMDNYPDE